MYDHRVREQVVRTGNPDLFPELEIPRKTALSWIRRGMREVVTRCKAMPLSAALRVLGLSSSRYHAWVNANDARTLDDRPSCPRSKVQRLTFDEVQAIGDMVQSTQHRHMSVRGLALHARRIGQSLRASCHLEQAARMVVSAIRTPPAVSRSSDRLARKRGLTALSE